MMYQLICALGTVQVSSTWSEPRPSVRLWRTLKGAVPHPWKTTNLPGLGSGKF
jgi:hypothetical protein